MSDGYAGHLETGRFRPAVETLKGLAGVLGVAYGELAVLAGYISPGELWCAFRTRLDRRTLHRSPGGFP